MASNAEMVGEFREVADKVIDQQIDRCKNGPGLRSTWPGYDKEAKAASLLFSSLEPEDGRYTFSPHGEGHVWTISPDREMVISDSRIYKGRVAIVSFASEGDRLFRNWTFKSALSLLGIGTQRAIEDPEEIEGVVEWAKSPHLYEEGFNAVTRLTDQEKDEVYPRLEADAEQARKHFEDSKFRTRQPIPHLGPIGTQHL